MGIASTIVMITNNDNGGDDVYPSLFYQSWAV